MKYFPCGSIPPARPPLIGTILISFLASTSITAIPFGSCWHVVNILESSILNIASLAPGQLISTISIGLRVAVLNKVR